MTRLLIANAGLGIAATLAVLATGGAAVVFSDKGRQGQGLYHSVAVHGRDRPHGHLGPARQRRCRRCKSLHPDH
jgi:hypothetical protein